MDFRLAINMEILSLCQERNLTITQLAEISGVPISTVKNILSGQSHNPGILTLLALCDGLQIELADFITAAQQRTQIPNL
ncbi:MAG: helix-turn-helix transcriptional regulator [Firmicutes bacterium]|nr:helix-turn-helix transcriptional regulator [Bacillota bacterium]MBQ3198837.1 helix-turn-helix transcriptional regulator [Bacillota bacterium]